MRILVISPRLPARNGKGDQIRALHLVEALARDHAVTVLTTATAQPGADLRALARVEAVPVTRPRRLLGALAALLRGMPAEVGYMVPGHAWRRVRSAARDADVVLAITARALRGPLGAPVVLDHVDALSLNLARRARGAESLPIRLATRVEAPLMRRWERRLSRFVSAQAAVSAADAAALPAPPPVAVVGTRVDIPDEAPDLDAPRSLDVAFTGIMTYGPNLDAAQWISREIAPALWERMPEARIAIIGREASGLRLDPRIEIRSDVPSVHACLLEAKVALVPLRLGTGSPNKALEAIVAGAAVVGTPAALEPLGLPDGAAAAAPDAGGLADAVAALLRDDAARAAAARAAFAALGRFSLDAQSEALARLLPRS